MKNTLSVSALAISLIALSGSLLLYLKKEKIVYVDSIKLVAGYNGSKLLKAEFELKATNWKAKLDTLSTELSTEIAKYEKEEGKMSAKERINSEKRITMKQEEFENYRKVITESVQKEDQRISTQVLKEISNFLKKYGEEKGYKFIMGATNVGNIVYAAKDTDITNEVLTELNKQYK